MDNRMKKISVSDSCAACGACVVNSAFMMEAANGCAVPKEPGLISQEQYAEFQTVVNDCPVHAILVEDESISALDGTDAVIKLKSMINEKIKNYKIPYPIREEYDFSDKDYEAPPLISQGLSKSTYKSYDKAKNEGFSAFKNTMFSQQKALIQAVCIEYKTRQLNKFAYYEKEKGNYFFDNNRIISNMLEEAAALGQAISNNKLKIPKDFSTIDIGPDHGFEGDIWCWVLRNIEQLDWNDKMEDEDFFKTYVNVEDYGDEYKYSLYEVEDKFREYIVFGLYLQLSNRVDETIDNIYNKYCEIMTKTLNDKLALLKTELKKCVQLDDQVNAKKEDVIGDITSLINEIKSIPLAKEIVHHFVDQEYDHTFRFPSYSKASEAAGNRTSRYYEDCSFYFGTRHCPSISDDLSKAYQKQFEAVINKFKTKLQEIFDKYDLQYPKEYINISCDENTINFNISDYEDVKSYIDRDIYNFIEDKVIGYGGAFKKSDYFTYSDVSYEVNESITWKQGLFGEKEVPIFAYLVSFWDCYTGFDKAISFCCDYVFESDYIKSFRSKMLASLEKEVKEKILKKITV